MLEFTSPLGKLYFPSQVKFFLKFIISFYPGEIKVYQGWKLYYDCIFFWQITGLENDLAQEKLKVLEVRERERE